jgi:CheY-like chemotaxis protein
MSRTIEVDFLPPAFEETKEKPRILIIDDNRDFTHSAKLALERAGRYSVWEENEPARAANKGSDASTRQLLGALAEAERKHMTLAENLQQKYLTPEVEAQEEKAHRRLFVLQIVQPGVAGLMDGSVSTLAHLQQRLQRTAATPPS